MPRVNGPREPASPHAPRGADPLPWIGLSVVALFLLSYPWLAPFTQGRELLGIPLILWYVFGVWGVLILFGGLMRPRK